MNFDCYIKRRARDIYMFKCMHICNHTCTTVSECWAAVFAFKYTLNASHMIYYIYIYIQLERGSESERRHQQSHSSFLYVMMQSVSQCVLAASMCLHSTVSVSGTMEKCTSFSLGRFAAGSLSLPLSLRVYRSHSRCLLSSFIRNK